MTKNTAIGNAGGDGPFYDHCIRTYNNDLVWNADHLFNLWQQHRTQSPNRIISITETGIGTGRFAKEFLDRVDAAGQLEWVRYHGYDHSASQLEQAQKTLAPYADQVRLEEANVLDESFFLRLTHDTDIVTNSSFLNYVPPAKLTRFLKHMTACLATRKQPDMKSIALFHAANAEPMRDFVLFAEALLENEFGISNPEKFRIRHHHNLPENRIETAVETFLQPQDPEISITDKVIPMKVARPESWIRFWASGYQRQLTDENLRRFNTTLAQQVRDIQKECGDCIPTQRRAAIYSW